VLAPNANLRALVVPQVPGEAIGASEIAATESGCAHSLPARISWARLLTRVFQIDLEHCPNCGGQLKIIAAILEHPVIEKILTHLGLQARAPPRAPSPWVAAPSGLRSSSRHVSGGPVPKAAGSGWARAFQGRGLAPDRKGKPGVGHHG